ncbi:MAG: DUF58 domain-containing protein, partial [Acidimicrobiales bacterium]
LFLAAALLAVLAASAATALLSSRNLSARVRTDLPTAPVRVDDLAALTHKVLNAGARPLERAFLSTRRARLPLVLRDESLVAVSPLVPGDEVEITVDIPTARRGITSMPPAWLWAFDPLGMFAWRVATAPCAHVVICPQPASLRGDVRVGLGASGSPERASGEQRAASRAAEADWTGVRPYAGGDRLSLVHWPTSARHGRLFVRDFPSGAAARLVLFVDVRPGCRASAGYEDAISLSAALGLAALEDGCEVVVGSLDEAGGRRCAIVTTPDALLANLAVVDDESVGHPTLADSCRNGSEVSAWSRSPGGFGATADQVVLVTCVDGTPRAVHGAGSRLGPLLDAAP